MLRETGRKGEDMKTSFFFKGDDGSEEKISSLTYGKAIVKLYPAAHVSGHLVKDGRKLCRIHIDGLSKIIEYIEPLSDDDISILNDSSWPRYAFVNGLLRSGVLQSASYIDKDQHGRRAELTVIRSDAVWKFDIPCGCRQYENTPMEELINLHHPINLRRL